jgi:hypothetical protein
MISAYYYVLKVNILLSNHYLRKESLEEMKAVSLGGQLQELGNYQPLCS